MASPKLEYNLTIAGTIAASATTILKATVSDKAFVVRDMVCDVCTNVTPFYPIAMDGGPNSANNTAIGIGALTIKLFLDDQQVSNVGVFPHLLFGSFKFPRILVEPWTLPLKTEVRIEVTNASATAFLGSFVFRGQKQA